MLCTNLGLTFVWGCQIYATRPAFFVLHWGVLPTILNSAGIISKWHFEGGFCGIVEAFAEAGGFVLQKGTLADCIKRRGRRASSFSRSRISPGGKHIPETRDNISAQSLSSDDSPFDFVGFLLGIWCQSGHKLTNSCLACHVCNSARRLGMNSIFFSRAATRQ